MGADTWVKAYAVDDLLGIKPLHLRICIELIEVRHTESKVCIGKELHSLSLLESHEQGRDVLLERSLLQESCKSARSLLHAVEVCNHRNCAVLILEVVDELRSTYDDT